MSERTDLTQGGTLIRVEGTTLGEVPEQGMTYNNGVGTDLALNNIQAVLVPAGTRTVAPAIATQANLNHRGVLLFLNVTGVPGALPAPAAPAPTTAATGGTIAAGVYGVEITYVNTVGETVASANGPVTTTGTTSTITIPSPVASGTATGWYAYVTQAGGATFTRQQAAGSPTAIGTALTLTAPPTTTGVTPPSANTTAGAGGLTVRLQAIEPVTGTAVVNLLTATAVTATGLYTYAYYPGLPNTAAALGGLTLAQNGILPRVWTATVTPSDTSSYAYSLAYALSL